MPASARNPYERHDDPIPTLFGALDREWTLQAACNNHPDRDRLFWPPRARSARGMKRSASEQRRRLIIAEAKSICATCPVTQQCLDYSNTIGDWHAIWGGRTPRERGRKRDTP